jgi:hypothetical protein
MNKFKKVAPLILPFILILYGTVGLTKGKLQSSTMLATVIFILIIIVCTMLLFLFLKKKC